MDDAALQTFKKLILLLIHEIKKDVCIQLTPLLCSLERIFDRLMNAYLFCSVFPILHLSFSFASPFSKGTPAFEINKMTRRYIKFIATIKDIHIFCFCNINLPSETLQGLRSNWGFLISPVERHCFTCKLAKC